MAGTAFFIGVELPGTQGFWAYTVTARHVIDAIARYSVDDTVLIRMNETSGEAVLHETALKEWRAHSDRSVDVSVFPYTPVYSGADIKFIHAGMVVNKDVEQRYGLGVGDDVFVTGLFVSHFGRRRNLPIIRVGTIAMLPEEPILTPEFGEMRAYLIEARSIGGLSGSPVFVHFSTGRQGIPLPEGVTRETLDAMDPIERIAVIGEQLEKVPQTDVFFLLGLIHGHWDLPKGERDIAIDQAILREQLNVGIAAVVPSDKIMEAINSPELAEMREKARQKSPSEND